MNVGVGGLGRVGAGDERLFASIRRWTRGVLLLKCYGAFTSPFRVFRVD